MYMVRASAKCLTVVTSGMLSVTACVQVPVYESRGVTTDRVGLEQSVEEPGYLYDYPGGYAGIYRYGYYLPYPVLTPYYPVLIGGGRPVPAEPDDSGNPTPEVPPDVSDTPSSDTRPRGMRPRDVEVDDRVQRGPARARPKVSSPAAGSAPQPRGASSGARSTPTPVSPRASVPVDPR